MSRSVPAFVMAATLVGCTKPASTPRGVSGVVVEFRRASASPAEGLAEAIVAGSGDKIYLHASVDVSNAEIASAAVTRDFRGRPAVEVTFTSEGQTKMKQLTAAHIDKPLAVLVDGEVVCAPIIKAPVERAALITGDFSEQDATRIAAGILAR